MRLTNVGKAPVVLAFAIVFVSGCGSDSTGPTSLDATSALQSLALGLNQLNGVGTPTTSEADAAFAAIAPVLDQVNVTIDGASQGMYAFGLRESFPDGTCEETLFIDPLFPPEPGVCTPPPLGLAVILWQSHSASERPDRMILLAGDVGTSNFDFTQADFPAVAIYLTGQDRIWASTSGTLTSQVASTNQSCDIPLPPYAKSGTCSIATFNEQGSVMLSEFVSSAQTFDNTNRVNTVTIGIPSMTLHGVWLAITEVQPVQSPWDYSRSFTRGLSPLLVRVPPLFAPGKSRISGRP